MSSKVFSDAMIREMLSLKAEGATAGEIATFLNKKYRLNLKKQAIFDKLHHLKDQGVSASQEDGQAPIFDISTVSNDDLAEIENGRAMEVGSEYSAASGLFTKTILHRPLTDREKATPEALLRALGFDPKTAELKTFKESAWSTQGKNGKIVHLTSIRYSISYKESALTLDGLDAIVEAAKKRKGNFKAFPRDPRHALGGTLMIPIADLHYGLVSAGYSTQIAAERVEKTISEAISFGEGLSDLVRIVLVLGNDFFNSDTVQGTTVKGTPQDQENAETKGLFTPAFNMVVDAINTLATHAPVTVLSVASNHDELSTYHLMEGLRQLYSRWTPPKCHDISVEFNTYPRTYHEFGTNLVGFAHDYKQKDVIGLMASEVPDLWGKARHKYFFLAHLHKEITIEDVYGLGVHRLPTISGKSKWSVAQGYVGTEEQNKVYLFDDENGLIGEWYVKA